MRRWLDGFSTWLLQRLPVGGQSFPPQVNFDEIAIRAILSKIL